MRIGAIASAAGAAARGHSALPQDLASTFGHGLYSATRLTSDMRVYRVFGEGADKVGRWFTAAPPTSGEAARSSLQLYNNAATHIVEAVIPRGTTIYQGLVAGSSTNATQIFVRSPEVLRVGPVTRLL